jgi:hypothetical protein
MTSFSNATQSAFNTLGLGLTGGGTLPLSPWWPGIFFRRAQYWHRVDVPNGAQVLTFFNAQRQDFVTNLPSPGTIPGDTGMWVSSLRFQLTRGWNVAGTSGAAGQQYATTADPWSALNEAQQVLQQAQVELSIGPRQFEPIHGLDTLPAGAGINVDGIAGSIAATHMASNFSNGVPFAANAFAFTPPHPIYPNDNIVLRVRWPAGLTISANRNFVLKAILDGHIAGRA